MENSIVDLTSNMIADGKTDSMPAGNGHVTDLLEKTNLKLKMTEYNLARLIDSGELHVQLNPNQPESLVLAEGIPACFKLNLADFTFPILFKFSYGSKEESPFSIMGSYKVMNPNADDHHI